MGRVAETPRKNKEVIIIEVAGGLGNQMFQYALYQKYLHMGKAVKLDLFSYENPKSMPFELDLFHLPYDVDTKKERSGYMDQKRLSVYRILDQISGRPKHSYYAEKLDVGYQPEILNFENTYLSGYWQCEKYFMDFRQDVLDLFQFPDQQINLASRSLQEQMRREQAVAVHVRRGDYLLPENSRKYGNICTLQYYKNAMQYMKKRVPDARFYFFSNDPGWVRENLATGDSVIVDCNHGKENYLDMYLMSQCSHNIIANSSFSWWGAWLNQNPDKIVMSPQRWFSHLEFSDAICEGWIRING